METKAILFRSAGVLGERPSSTGSRTSCLTRSRRTRTLWMPSLSGTAVDLNRFAHALGLYLLASFFAGVRIRQHCGWGFGGRQKARGGGEFPFLTGSKLSFQLVHHLPYRTLGYIYEIKYCRPESYLSSSDRKAQKIPVAHAFNPPPHDPPRSLLK